MTTTDWTEIFHHGPPRPKPLDRELAALTEQHAAPYPDPERRAWIERRLREWWERRG